jgi:hypothetical protein
MIVIVGLFFLAGRPRLFARRPAGRPETLPGQAAAAQAAQTPASASAPAE